MQQRESFLEIIQAGWSPSYVNYIHKLAEAGSANRKQPVKGIFEVDITSVDRRIHTVLNHVSSIVLEYRTEKENR